MRMQQKSQFVKRLVTSMVLLGAVSVNAMADSCIWYADDDTIRQVQTSTNQITHVVPLRNPQRLIMNATDCGVWVLDKNNSKLLRYSADGVLEREIRVRNLDSQLDEVDLLHIDPYDGSLWITDDRRIDHVTPTGQLITSFSAPGEVRRMQVALDRSLWALGKRDLWHFDPNGKLLATYTLGRHLAGDARYFELDNLGGVIWLADDNSLAQLKLVNPVDPPLRIRVRRDVTGFTLDPFTGNVWVAQKEALLAYSRAGALVHTTDLESRNLRNPEKLAFDPISRSLWAGTERSINRFTDSGEFVVRFAARDGDEALGVPAFKVEPTLTLVRPPQNALTNSPQPLFTLNYGAACNSVVCTFPNDYLAGYRLTATLNSLAVGPQFLFDLGTGQSSFTPATRLPEGANTFSAQVKDGFGTLSNTVTNAFTVDTIAPRFLTVVPLNGAVIPTPLAILQGTTDDPQATVVLEGTGLNQTGANFSFPVILQSGANIFILSAIDRAGNRTSLSRTLIRASLSINIAAPTPSATVSGSTVLVSGTFQGPSNTGVTVNEVVAVTDNGVFYAQVPLQPGSNQLNAVATSPDGTTVTQAITVTNSGSSPISITASPVYGVAPYKVTFDLQNATGRTITQIQADYNGDGAVDFTTANASATLEFTYTTPGIYTARFTVLDDQNASYPISTIVQVIDAARLDQVLRATWGGMASALAHGDKAQALQFLNTQAREKYGPVFDTLISGMPQILGSFSNLQTVSISGDLGEYAINRMINGVNRVFFIYLIRDIDGVWRIDSM